MQHKNIIIIGPLGVGKTTTGKQVAKKLQMVFYDTDQEIEKQTGVSVSTIYEFEGELGFRQREKEMVVKLTELDNIVLSTGGESILLAENRALFQERGLVIYLRASLETQLDRTNRRRGVRPTLNTTNPHQKIIEFEQIRAPLYQSIANHTFDTDKFSPSDIANQIAALWSA